MHVALLFGLSDTVVLGFTLQLPIVYNNSMCRRTHPSYHSSFLSHPFLGAGRETVSIAILCIAQVYEILMKGPSK